MADVPTTVTDGGIETDLIHRRRIALREFASFPLVESTDGRAVLRSYFDDYAAVASAHGRALMLESPTWRANPDWGALLDYSPQDLTRVNVAAIEFMVELRRAYAATVDGDIRVSGTIGPRRDGYSLGGTADRGIVHGGDRRETRQRYDSRRGDRAGRRGGRARLLPGELRPSAPHRGCTDGDPADFADAQRRLIDRLPHLSIVGGCCGTDARHVAAFFGDL